MASSSGCRISGLLFLLSGRVCTYASAVNVPQVARLIRIRVTRICRLKGFVLSSRLIAQRNDFFNHGAGERAGSALSASVSNARFYRL